MKKLLAVLLALVLTCSVTAALGGSITIGVPNDPTNLSRALQLLAANGIITLKEDVGVAATVRDIIDNPFGVEIVEVEAVQLPIQLPDLSFAIINSNYAISAGLNPVADGLLIEGSYGAYGNILTVKEGNENLPKILALKAALESQQVVEFIAENGGGSVVSTVDTVTDGYNADIDYDALKGTTVSVAASPTPHAEILTVVKEILAAKGITLEIIEFTDYVQPNLVVDAGEIDANYFQHLPYLLDFNAENGTKLVSVADIHVEPMALYGGTETTLSVFGR